MNGVSAELYFWDAEIGSQYLILFIYILRRHTKHPTLSCSVEGWKVRHSTTKSVLILFHRLISSTYFFSTYTHPKTKHCIQRLAHRLTDHLNEIQAIWF